MLTISDVHICTADGLTYGDLTIGDDGRIARIVTRPAPAGREGLLLLPGCVDAHVHFREPGLTHKADIASESLAAAAGGVTYVLDMPNVLPTTTTPEALAAKHRLYREHCRVGYGLWYGITADNIDQALSDYGRPDSPHRDEICGFKVFLGSSTGGMLMDDADRLRHLMAGTQRVIGVHSESETLIAQNRRLWLGRALAERAWGAEEGDLPIDWHPRVRNAEACLATTRLAVGLALATGAQLHLCHLTSALELDYLAQTLPPAAAGAIPQVTAEACVAHLWFSQGDYARLGALIKCNPAIKGEADRAALRRALADGRIYGVATDHAPHLPADKQGGALKAASGMPSVQFSLLAMLQLVSEGVLPLTTMVRLMATHPARRFGLEGRGEIRPGAHADLTLVSTTTPTTVGRDTILSKCGWSPFEGTTFGSRVLSTWVDGRQVYADPLCPAGLTSDPTIP